MTMPLREAVVKRHVHAWKLPELPMPTSPQAMIAPPRSQAWKEHALEEAAKVIRESNVGATVFRVCRDCGAQESAYVKAELIQTLPASCWPLADGPNWMPVEGTRT